MAVKTIHDMIVKGKRATQLNEGEITSCRTSGNIAVPVSGKTRRGIL